MQNGIGAYQREDTLGKSQLDLILKVYDGALAAYRKTRQNYLDEDFTTGYENLEHAKRFITHLYTTLDMDKGGEVAANLDRVYGYCVRRLSDGHVNDDDKALGEVSTHLTELGSAWREVASRNPRAQETSELTPRGATPVAAR